MKETPSSAGTTTDLDGSGLRSVDRETTGDTDLGTARARLSDKPGPDSSLPLV